MKTILIILSLLLPVNSNINQKKAKIIQQFAPVKIDTSYQYAVNVIKKYEKYSNKEYNLFGDRYIGYGHLIKKGDTMTSLTEMQADSLLRVDLNYSLKMVKSCTNRIPVKRKMLLACFVFNCGIGRLKSSVLLSLINNHKPDSIIEKQYLGYVFANGEMIPKLKLRRIDEFKLWK